MGVGIEGLSRFGQGLNPRGKGGVEAKPHSAVDRSARRRPRRQSYLDDKLFIFRQVRDVAHLFVLGAHVAREALLRRNLGGAALHHRNAG